MSIQALPVGTIRAIGASQVLCDPSFVVKELVENALDAHASAIYVEISANTLDVLQVRDNGHGIAPEDRPLACRRYCTSKLRQYSDLKSIGGTSLGFRGEALACAAELSTTLTLTTRVEGEAIATALGVSQLGEIQSQEPASHPVGTTIRLTDLFHYLPVRRQTALKTSSKCLAKIKSLMQGYALARHSTRLSLKILHSKTSKPWIYVPSAAPSVQDAVLKIIGKDCAAQCTWSVMTCEDYKVQAFLPSPDADLSKVSNMGHFLCVDLRPVSTCRGTLKQILGMFRDSFKAVIPGVANIKDPFLWLNIDCPGQSYDPNVEPAKDDVLFEDSEKVVRAVQALFNKCYPHSQTASGAAEFSSAPYEADPNEAPFTETDEATSLQEQHTNEFERHRAGRNAWNSNGYEDEPGILPESSEPTVLSSIAFQDEEIPSTLRDVNVSNPWIIAKMNSSVRQRHIDPPPNAGPPPALRERNASQINSDFSIPSDYSSPVLSACTADGLVPQVEVLHNRLQSCFEQDSNQTAAGRSEETQSCPLPQQESFIIARQQPSVARGPASAFSKPNPSLPRRIGLRKHPTGRALNKPFVSPILNRVESLFGHAQRAAPVAKGTTRRLDANQTAVDSHASFAPSEIGFLTSSIETGAGEVELAADPPQPTFPSDDLRVDGGAMPSLTITMQLSISIDALSALSIELETLNDEILGTGHRDAHLLRCYEGRPKHADAGDDGEGTVAPVSQQHVQTSLLEPPVEVWEMQAWEARVMRLLERYFSGRLHEGGSLSDGERVDIVRAMEGFAAGSLCV